MLVKQIGLKEAMELAAKGREVMVMAPSIPEPKQWGDYCPDTVQGMLSGCMFFRREPAMANPGMEAQDSHTDGDAAGASGSAAEQAGKRVGAGGKRKRIDTGKILALHKAGWSNVKIAEEMGTSDVTVGKYLKQMKEGQDENSQAMPRAARGGTDRCDQ